MNRADQLIATIEELHPLDRECVRDTEAAESRSSVNTPAAP